MKVNHCAVTKSGRLRSVRGTELELLLERNSSWDREEAFWPILHGKLRVTDFDTRSCQRSNDFEKMALTLKMGPSPGAVSKTE
jgi:hypothetical protein